MNLNLKKLLKNIKLNENTISMVLGAIVVLVVGSLVVNYVRNRGGSIPQELLDQNSTVQEGEKLHTVATGETLWSIAQNYYQDGYKWVDIATENKLENASVIEIGQELIIPNLGSESMEQEDAMAEDSTMEAKDAMAQEGISAATYEVVKGDSLWKIAVRAYGDGYKWVEIANENKLTNPNVIHPGNVLVLPR